ncbi:MAG: helix-hairpin-helix domain-containing protein [Gemmatimonadetes bacterium]|nr:helix-hairpin-helix domain-containing protein [Gemmatimonadota bacterium]MYG15441.1 helix-hairpin-helix domain-containing protein [Gemmatimonadota bacterium]
MRLFMKPLARMLASASIAAMMCLPEERAAQDLDYSIDALIDRQAADIDPEDIALLVSLRRDPLDINRADRTELEQLPWITPALAGAIVAWRERHGSFGNAGELVRVQGFTPVLVSRISPFVRVVLGRAEDDRSLETTGRLRLARSRTDRPDAPGNGILGVQADIGLGNRFKLGGRGERRDRGGETRWRSGYVEFGGSATSRRLILGYFEMDFGQGLIWRSHSIRPSTASLSASVKRRIRGLRPVRTTYASGARRGMAMRIDRRGFNLTGILSRADSGKWEPGGRLGWSRNSGLVGISVLQSDGSLRVGTDLDYLYGGTNLFGEMAIDGEGYQTVQAGMVWSMEGVEGGLTFHRQPDARLIEKTERTWQSLLLRWRPDRRTTLQLSVEPRLTYLELYRRSTMRFRRRVGRGVIASGVWRREMDERQATGSALLDTWRGQVAWRVPARVQWRARYERRGRYGLKPEHDMRLYMRYRSRDRFSLSAQWEYTLSEFPAPEIALAGFPDPESSASLFRSNHRERWVILLYGPVGPGVSTLIRYTRTRQTRYDQLKVPIVETRWVLQLNARW